MIPSQRPTLLFFLLLAALNLRAGDLDTIGITLLRNVAPGLEGNGIRVGQPEGAENVAGAFEVDPSTPGQPTNLFTWISSAGTATNYPNGVGTMSYHAGGVANVFYGTNAGVARGVSHVDNYDADYFYSNYISGAVSIADRLVNQSFIFTADSMGTHYTTNEERAIDLAYDDYANQYGVLFVSGAGNGGPDFARVYPAATSYNGIGVGVYPGSTSVGPTTDGRSKPDLVGPGGITSFSTPYVCGSAAVLIQAALQGDGGADTNSANDNRTIKALLLNGAVKPPDWVNGVTTPLDPRYGAGIVNVFNAWNQMRNGKHPFIEATTVANGSAHPPGANSSNEPALSGWDLNSLANPDTSHDRINHYYFNLPGSNSFTLTATLTWLRPHSTILGPSGINDLNLFLYNTANGQLILSSTSAVDNVEHLYLPKLPPGRYDLQVLKNAQSQVSPGETYALAFEFFNLPLNITLSNDNVVLSWPLAPTGFQLQSTSSITPPVTWSPMANAVVVDTNANLNLVTVPLTDVNQFFRLQR